MTFLKVAMVLLMVMLISPHQLEAQTKMQQPRFPQEQPNEVIQKVYLPWANKIAVVRMVFNGDEFWPQFILVEDPSVIVFKQDAPDEALSKRYIPEEGDNMQDGNFKMAVGWSALDINIGGVLVEATPRHASFQDVSAPLTLLPDPGEGKHWEVRETYVAGQMHFVPIVMQDNVFKRYALDVLKILGGIVATVVALFAKNRFFGRSNA